MVSIAAGLGDPDRVVPDAMQHEVLHRRSGTHAPTAPLAPGSAEQHCTLHRIRDDPEGHPRFKVTFA